jgi:hypothetical protein
MKSVSLLCLYLFLCLFLDFPSAFGQSMFFQRGPDKFPVRVLPDGGRSVVIDGQTYFLVAKEDLSALSAESEALRAVVTRNDTLFAKHEALLSRYARYEDAAETLTTRQESQLLQAEKINRAYDDLYNELKRIAGISPWSIAAGIGVQSFDSEMRLAGSLGIGYRHWTAQYQFARKYEGVLVGFRLAF